MSDKEAIYEAILAYPDDDTPRLIYADWLDENGESDRAEFIRLQCQLRRSDQSTEQMANWRRREQNLVRQFGMEWQHDLPAFEGIRWGGFERGFVAHLWTDEPRLLQLQMAAVLRATPIQHLHLQRFDATHIRNLVEQPWLSKIVELDLEDGSRIGNSGLEAIADSEYAHHLETLKLGSNQIGPAGVQALARSNSLRQLRQLNLDQNDLYDEPYQAFAEATFMTYLERLSLAWTRLSDDGVRDLLDSPHIMNLDHLRLTNNLIGDDGAEAIARSVGCRHLRELLLNSNRIGDRGAIALARSRNLPRLQYLYLRENRIGDAGGFAFAESEYFQEIRQIHLGENPLEASLAALRHRLQNRIWIR